MMPFEYAQPTSEAEALEMLRLEPGQSSIVLAGGTDLVPLLKKMLLRPQRVVNIAEIESLKQIDLDPELGLVIGAAVSLDEFFHHSLTGTYASVKQAIQGIASIQLQSQGTLVGELCRYPTCWYFRGGHGLLAQGGRLVEEGDHRFHAIFANRGAAKYSHASRLAPALMALGAELRIVGPEPDDEQLIPLAEFYRIPRHDHDAQNVLGPRQLITHVILPPVENRLSAHYEIRHGVGPDQPLASAACALTVESGIIERAAVVLGQVAPLPWISADAERALIGQPLEVATIDVAAAEATAAATPLPRNKYKVQLAEVAVRRALRLAAGIDIGGFC